MFEFSTSLARSLDRIGLPVPAVQALATLLFISCVPLLVPGNMSPRLAAGLFVSGTLLELTSRQMSLLREEDDISHLAAVLLRFGGYGLFFTALGIHLYLQSTTMLIYPFALLLFTLLWIYLVFLVGRYPVDIRHAAFGLHRTDAVLELKKRSSSRMLRLLLNLGRLADPGYFPLVVSLLVISGLTATAFWYGLIALTLFLWFKILLLRLFKHEYAVQVLRGTISYLFYIGGTSVLLLLVLRMPFSDLLETISAVGWEDIWIILIPTLWVIPYAMTLQVLLDFRVSLRDAMYTQMTGDAFNSITPLLGMGGEPYKAGHLARFVPLEDAGCAIIQSRLIHAVTGILFTIIVLIITLLTTDLSSWPGAVTGMVTITIVLSAALVVLTGVTLSMAPAKATAFILSKLKIPGDVRLPLLGLKKFWLAFLCKMAGRCAKFLELYLIFMVLDMSPGFAEIMLVEALIMISVSLFFFVPQGMGVNETGIVTAFSIIGYPAPAAVVFGLIRRARMIFYTLSGLLLFLLARLRGFIPKDRQAR